MTSTLLLYYRTLYSQSVASLTIGSLAAYLRSRNIPTTIHLLRRTQLKENEMTLLLPILHTLDKDPQTIIVAKVNFKDFDVLIPLLKKIYETRKCQRIFLCGPFATLHHNSIMLENPWLSGILYGYPEKAAEEVITKIKNGEDFSCVNGGIFWSQKGMIEKTGNDAFIALDDLPFPARDIEIYEPETLANIEASRGCAYRCSYCHINPSHICAGMTNRDVRSMKKVVEEIEYLNKKLGKQFFIFNDSHFWMNKNDDQRILSFCDEIKRLGLNINYYIYLRCRPFPDESIIKAMAETGLARVFLGVENSSEKTISLFKKGTKSYIDFFTVKGLLSKYHINIHIGFIVFNPLISIGEVRENIDYLYRINKLPRIGILNEQIRLVPNSEFSKMVHEAGLTVDNNRSYHTFTFGYNYKYNNVAELYREIDHFYRVVTNSLPYDVEYFCVTGQLLIDLCAKKNLVIDTETQNRFETCLNEVNEWMYVFLKDIMNKLNRKGKIGNDYWHQVAQSYRELYLNTQITWSTMIYNLEKRAPELVHQLYKGGE